MLRLWVARFWGIIFSTDDSSSPRHVCDHGPDTHTWQRHTWLSLLHITFLLNIPQRGRGRRDSLVIVPPPDRVSARACVSLAYSKFSKVPLEAPPGSLKLLPRILVYSWTLIYVMSSLLSATQASPDLLLKPRRRQEMSPQVCTCPHGHG